MYLFHFTGDITSHLLLKMSHVQPVKQLKKDFIKVLKHITENYNIVNVSMFAETFNITKNKLFLKNDYFPPSSPF